MAKASAVWGIDVGQCALKAVKLRSVGDEVAVEAFDIIEHEKNLSQPDADRTQLIRSALEQFLARNSVGNTPVFVSMPGLTSFPCYVKLPPVETKKVPDIVRFEAQQQIPLPLSEVVWQYQKFQDPDSPDIEVGIFAVRRTDLAAMLAQFAAVNLRVDAVQMAPLAMFNFMEYDGQRAADGATLLIDVGADKTDLVVADKGRLWTRTIRIGGNNFTEALVRGFKLSFGKAEKLKHTAATSKYARQIFQAMRPVFADLVQEIQRSLGHYTSLHRDARLKKILALGSGFRLPGFQKYLEQNLNIPVAQIDGYNKLKTTGPADTPVFTENIMSFAVAYGLALQGLGLAVVDTNLLPTEISRKRRWDRKRPWFAGAGACLVLAAAGLPWRTLTDRSALEARSNPGSSFQGATQIGQGLAGLRAAKAGLAGKGDEDEKKVKYLYDLYAYRDQVPVILSTINRSFMEYAKDQPYFGATEADRQKAINKLAEIPRAKRRMVTLDTVDISYIPDVMKAAQGMRAPSATPGPSASVGKPGWKVTIRGHTPLPRSTAESELIAPIQRKADLVAAEPLPGGLPSPIRIFDKATAKVSKFTPVSESPGASPAAPAPAAPAGTGAGAPAVLADPLMAWASPVEGNPLVEDMTNDTSFDLTWVIEIENNGLPPLMATKTAEAGASGSPQ